MKLADGTEWVLVPKVRTTEMHDAYHLTDLCDDRWSAQLAAAPQPPVDEMVASVSEILTEFSDVECSFDTIARAIVARLIGEKS